MIVFQNVSKTYDYQTVLRNVSFTIQKGEMTYITGPSGAGKSTLLKLIYMAERPDDGDIIVGDFNLSLLKEIQIPLLRRSVGVVFQDFKLIQNMTVFDNIALAMRIKKTSRREIHTLVAEALKMVNLLHKADSYPKSLSGGEQQRTAIARAIVTKPLVILADEPTGNLDSNTASDIITLFNALNTQGATIIIATHNKELFRNSRKRVLHLDGGNIVSEDLV